MKVLDTLVEQVSGSFLNYLRLGTWLDYQITHRLSGRPHREFESVEGFWQSILNEELYPGDKIVFKQAYVTEWTPRMPGQLWIVHRGKRDAFYSEEQLSEIRKGKGFWSESTLESQSISPMGVVRLPFGNDKLHYAALSITTIDSWCCDLGVPVVFSASVYDAFIRRRIKTE